MIQPNMPERIRLLALSGSLRKESTNTAILISLSEALEDKADMLVFGLKDIPLYNGDLDGGNIPAEVVALRQEIERSHGIVICSPEYNHGIPGVLKNALDWASRPALQSPLRGKPVLIMTSSPGFTGGVRAQYQIRETLCSALARVLARPQVVIAAVTEKVTGNRLIDGATLAFALGAIDDLLQEIRLLAHAGNGR